MKKWYTPLMLLLVFSPLLQADELEDKRDDIRREEDRVNDRKIEEERVERQREEARRVQRKLDDRKWEEAHRNR